MYVCGNTTTTSGLTVTLSKDSCSGDFALEAGALVLGDQGKRPNSPLFTTFNFSLILQLLFLNWAKGFKGIIPDLNN